MKKIVEIIPSEVHVGKAVASNVFNPWMIINASLIKKNIEWVITLITNVAEVTTMLKVGINGGEDEGKLSYNIFLYFQYFNFYCIRILRVSSNSFW